MEQITREREGCKKPSTTETFLQGISNPEEVIYFTFQVYQDMQSYRTEIANREKLKSSQIIDAASMAHSPAEPKILQDAGQKIANEEDNLILSNENNSSSETSHSARKFSEDDSDIEAYPEFGGTPITSRYQMRK